MFLIFFERHVLGYIRFHLFGGWVYLAASGKIYLQRIAPPEVQRKKPSTLLHPSVLTLDGHGVWLKKCCRLSCFTMGSLEFGVFTGMFPRPFFGMFTIQEIHTDPQIHPVMCIYICISRYGWVAISILIYHKKWPLSFNSFFRLKMAQVWLGKDKVTFSGRCLQPLLCVSGFAAKVARLSST